MPNTAGEAVVRAAAGQGTALGPAAATPAVPPADQAAATSPERHRPQRTFRQVPLKEDRVSHRVMPSLATAANPAELPEPVTARPPKKDPTTILVPGTRIPVPGHGTAGRQWVTPWHGRQIQRVAA